MGAAFILFGAALLCLIFFLLGTACKLLSSWLYGLLVSGAGAIGITILIVLGEIFLVTVYSIASGIRTSTLGETLGRIALFVFIFGIFAGLFGGLGAILLEVALVVGEAVVNVLTIILETATELFEKAYAYFLSVIMKCLDRC